jgi:glycosyltransferase involved in cell wall biosynthesis
MKKLNLAIVGIRGLPNNYGGFETLAEYLVEHLAEEINITVFCSAKDMETRRAEFKGAKLKYVPVTSHGSLGILYDSICLLIAVFKYDKVLFLGFGGGFIIPFLRRFKSKIILNIGGLDWKRDKWSPFAQKVIRRAEKFLVKFSGEIVSDNVGIQQYITNEYDRESTLIEYGGDQAQKRHITQEALEIYPFLKNDYAFIVTRIQADNNIEMILEAFTNQSLLPLVMVGNWDNSQYGIETKAKYLNKHNLILLDAIYDRQKLDILRSNCKIYIHGHSAGGTNPSLAEAMYLGLPVFAFASGYNEHTTKNEALYFHSKEELIALVNNSNTINLQAMGERLQQIAQKCYVWSTIANKYREIITKDINQERPYCLSVPA